VNGEETKQSRMRENLMSGIDEGGQDKLDCEAWLLLYSKFLISKMVILNDK
jgi:hypothetical protein